MASNERSQSTQPLVSVGPMDRVRRRWLCALAMAALGMALFLAGASPSLGSADAEAVVWLDAPTAPEAYSPFTLTVKISDVVGLNGAEMALRFPADAATVLDADPDSAGVQVAPGTCPAADFVVANSVDHGTGLVLYAVTQMYPTQPFTGSCDFALITMRPSRPGELPLTFDNLKLADAQGQLIASRSQELTLTVQSGTLFIYLPLMVKDAP